ncbi:hypothetical protein H0H81_007863 [Sphagnurus paluster]|uniref:Glycoside hydrolase family 5 domain-containing protein n=1 Tax=Sphagnurus paluster TaxID=117069 RepID=A0A9P7GR69_9AGAR|nr:hypothetical protein H0H81_007863 [Sphagnurus paluster]
MTPLSALVLLCLSFASTTLANVTPGFPYDSQKVRGVNLGGWLVLEPWITPSLFDNTNDSRIVDEYTFGQYQDRTKALNILKNHWDTWITEADFRDIAAAGLNHVRIPIGYWAYEVYGGEPYIQGQLPYLAKAINWASKYNLKVLVDLHGAPGSQNGFDNSGVKTSNPYVSPTFSVQSSDINFAIQFMAFVTIQHRPDQFSIEDHCRYLQGYDIGGFGYRPPE